MFSPKLSQDTASRVKWILGLNLFKLCYHAKCKLQAAFSGRLAKLEPQGRGHKLVKLKVKLEGGKLSSRLRFLRPANGNTLRADFRNGIVASPLVATVVAAILR